MPVKLREFDPSTIRQDIVILIIGPRNTGKSVLLRDLLFHTRKKFDFGVGVAGSRGAFENMSTFLPSKMIYNGFSQEAIDAFLKVSEEVNAEGKKRHGVLIEDDLFSNPNYLKHPTQTSLYMNGRWACASKISLAQYALFVPPCARSNIDLVFALRDPVMKNREKLFQYFFGSLSSLKEFSRVFDEATRDYRCLVLDKTSTSGAVEDSLFFYKANPQIPKFQLGRPIFFHLSDIIQEANARAKRKKCAENVRSMIV
jgi:hypothetical protein